MGGHATYFKVEKGIENNAKFGGFGYLTRDKYKDGRGAGSYGYGGLKGGYHIYFERQKTAGSQVINSAQIVFETMDAANNFLDKYYKIFK